MIKVLIVDDSAIVRRVLSAELSKAADINVVGTAIDPYIARQKILDLHPDVITLDLEMPRMGGLAFLAKLMKYHPVPVVVVSSLTPEGSEAAMRALELGAVDVIGKPGPGYAVEQAAERIIESIRAAAQARVAMPALTATAAAAPAPRASSAAPRYAAAGQRLIAIGASTGGTEAVKRVLVDLPADAPGVLIVQHMPAAFTAAFAARLGEMTLMEVREAADGDEIRPGLALVAPGDRHMCVRRVPGKWVVDVKTGPPVHHQRPSVDVLFYSMAQHVGAAAVGVILTGMGGDGAKGLLAMRQAGATTLAQDEATSVVYGMPKEAAKIGAAVRTLPINEISREVLRAIVRTPEAALTA